MKTYIFILLLLAMSAHMKVYANELSIDSKSRCNNFYTTSKKDLKGLRAAFEAYKNLSTNIAEKLIPAFRGEMNAMRTRIAEQKRECYAQEKREIDTTFNELMIEFDRLYLQDEVVHLKKKVDAIR